MYTIHLSQSTELVDQRWKHLYETCVIYTLLVIYQPYVLKQNIYFILFIIYFYVYISVRHVVPKVYQSVFLTDREDTTKEGFLSGPTKKSDILKVFRFFMIYGQLFTSWKYIWLYTK